jgi:pyruvate dehydrogenase E1 component beta subunit
MLYMSGGQFPIPMVIRGPGGSAHQLAAQHSQSLESWFCYVPGLKVVMPSTPADAKGLLKTAIRDDNPVVFIESEVLYGTRGEIPEGEHLIPLGVADIKRPGKDVTLIAHSKMVFVALEAAAELAKEGIEAEVVDPRTLRPLDSATLVESVKKTNRAVIVEEGWPFCGVGAQIVDTLQSQAFDYLDAPILRVTGADVPTPYAKNLEHLAFPDKQKVIDAANKVLYRT